MVLAEKWLIPFPQAVSLPLQWSFMNGELSAGMTPAGWLLNGEARFREPLGLWSKGSRMTELGITEPRDRFRSGDQGRFRENCIKRNVHAD